MLIENSVSSTNSNIFSRKIDQIGRLSCSYRRTSVTFDNFPTKLICFLFPIGFLLFNVKVIRNPLFSCMKSHGVAIKFVFSQ